MRKLVADRNGACRTFAAGSQTFSNRQAGTAPSWVSDCAAPQSSVRREPFFQFLEPLKLRFVSWLVRGAKLGGNQLPTAATWWPLVWSSDVDQCARPFSAPCSC
eukprot:919974-Pyramimonas_sp.AAC.1